MAKISEDTKNKLTDAVLTAKFMENQLYREEARQHTQEFLARFGVFVGLVNKTRGTSLSVEQALWTSDLVELYQSINGLISGVQSNPTPAIIKSQAKPRLNGKPKSTKRLSYEAFQVENGTSVAHAIYYHVKASPDALSRAQIAQQLKLRLSTVCGAVFQLIDAGLLTVTGTAIDAESNREVEIVKAR